MTDRIQYVSLGRSQSGKPGLFTGGMMAMPLSYEEYKKFLHDVPSLEAYCQRMGFTLCHPTFGPGETQ